MNRSQQNMFSGCGKGLGLTLFLWAGWALASPGLPDLPKTCIGSNFDLVELLQKPTCDLAEEPKDPKFHSLDLLGKLKTLLVPTTTVVKPGGQVRLSITWTNTGSQPIPLLLRFSDPPFFATALDENSNPVDIPPLSSPCADRPANESAALRTALVTILPGGKARAAVTWTARQHNYGEQPKEKNKPCPIMPGGPLPNGIYYVSVQTPLWVDYRGEAEDGLAHAIMEPGLKISVHP